MPEMTTRRLIGLCKKYYEAHQTHKTAEADKKALGEKIIPEMKRRGTKAMEAMGWKVTHVEQFYTVYDTLEAKRVLTREQFMAVTERVVTADSVASALSEGIIKPRQLAKFSSRKPKSSYVLVNPVQEGGE